MGNVGSGELLVIFLCALIVLGPARLPQAARQFARIVGEIRRVSTGFQRELREAMDVLPTDRQAISAPTASSGARGSSGTTASSGARGSSGTGDASADSNGAGPDPPVTESPTVAENPPVSESPTVAENPPVAESPTVAENPAVVESSAVTENPTASGEPVTTSTRSSTQQAGQPGYRQELEGLDISEA